MSTASGSSMLALTIDLDRKARFLDFTTSERDVEAPSDV